MGGRILRGTIMDRIDAIPRVWWHAAGLGMILAALAPVAAVMLRGTQSGVCEYDGQAIDSRYAVDIQASGDHHFCGIHCAQEWLRRSGQMPYEIVLRDEITGKPVRFPDAYFVRSGVVTNGVTGNRLHVFQDPDQARRHAAAYHGVFVDDADVFDLAAPVGDKAAVTQARHAKRNGT